MTKDQGNRTNRLVAVTGAAGFIGRAIVRHLADAGWQVRAIVRVPTAVHGAAEMAVAGDLFEAEPAKLVEGCEAVVHCAARVHVMRRENGLAAAEAYRRANSQLPVDFAKAARSAGARTFVQLSSAAAIASSSEPGETLDDASPPRPRSPYGLSKLEADLALAELAGPRFRVVSLRPPAVYGPGVGAHFARLARASRLGLPLPLGAIQNRRSFVFVGNLASALACTLERDLSGAWLITDGPPLSTADIYRRLLALHGHSGRVWRWPDELVRLAAKLSLGERADSLLGDAAFDGGRFCRDFQWAPPTSLDEALQQTVEAAAP